LYNNFADNHKSLSFLLHSDHGFVQAPLEAISKEHYDRLVANTRLITSVAAINTLNIEDASDCEAGACPIK